MFNYLSELFNKYEQLLKYLSVLIIVISAILIWYSPIIIKGYSPNKVRYNNLIAKNIIKTGRFSYESSKHVRLNTYQIKKKGSTSAAGQKLLPIALAGVYKMTEIPERRNTVYLISITVYSLALIFFFLTVWGMFGYLEAVLFSLIYILLPFQWKTAMNTGFYEFGLLFLSISLFLYFYNKKKHKWQYIIVGVFLGLTVLSRTALVTFLPAFILWIWFFRKNQRNKIVLLLGGIVSIIVLFSLFFQISFGPAFNRHLTHLGFDTPKNLQEDSKMFEHMYPDPYTYHFEKKEFIKKQKSMMGGWGEQARKAIVRLAHAGDSGIIFRLYSLKVVPIRFFERVNSLLSLRVTGGVLFVILGLWGIIRLYRQDKHFLFLSLMWFASSTIIASLLLVERHVKMDFGFVLALFVSLGIVELADTLKSRYGFQLGNKTLTMTLISLGVGGLFIMHLLSVNRYRLIDRYRNNPIPKKNAYISTIEKNQINKNSVVAVPFSGVDITYLTNVSTFHFQPQNIRKLLKKGELQKVFDYFGITHVMGYSTDLTKKILKETTAKNLSDNRIEPQEPVKNVRQNPLADFFLGVIK